MSTKKAKSRQQRRISARRAKAALAGESGQDQDDYEVGVAATLKLPGGHKTKTKVLIAAIVKLAPDVISKRAGMSRSQAFGDAALKMMLKGAEDIAGAVATPEPGDCLSSARLVFSEGEPPNLKPSKPIETPPTKPKPKLILKDEEVRCSNEGHDVIPWISDDRSSLLGTRCSRCSATWMLAIPEPWSDYLKTETVSGEDPA